MATKRRTRKKKTTPRRRKPARKPTRRRRRNPAMKFAAKDTLLAAAGGAAAGAGAYALDGVALDPNVKAAALGVGGLLLGIGITAFHKPLGFGIAGLGVGMAAKQMLDKHMAGASANTEGMGRLPDYGVRKYGHTPRVPYYRNMPMMGAVQADLGAVQTDLGAVEAQMSDVQASLY